VLLPKRAVQMRGARMPDKLPVVLSREELGQLLKQVDPTMWLIVEMLARG
jgi:hypothetical protein